MNLLGSSRPLTALIIYVLLILAIILLADLGGSAGTGTEYLRIIHAVPAGDKFGHFFLFGGLSFLANLVLAGRLKTAGNIRKHLLLTAAILAIVWLEEFSQLYLPNRNFDPWDMLADGAGILIFAALAIAVSHRQPRQET